MGQTMREVTIYSRSGCHLCEVAHQTLVELQSLKGLESFKITEVLIDGDVELTHKFGEQVPVIHIDGQPHDYFKVDPERFLKAIGQR